MEIIYRSEWNANPNKGSLVRMNTLNNIVIHHAAGYDDKNGSISYERVKEIQELHQTNRKWNDIGYHFLIDSTGCIFQGRDFFNNIDDINLIPNFIHGAHVKHNNSDKIGICLLGCYHPPEGSNCKKKLSSESISSLVELCVFICSHYSLKSSDILMHRDLRSSDCPGNNIANQLLSIKEQIESQLLLG